MTDPVVVRDATLSTPGVLAMHAGPYGTAATYSPAGRVWGVRIAEGRIDVHVVADESVALRALGRAVRDAVRRAAGGYPGVIAVHIEDITDALRPGEPAGTGATPIDREPATRRTP
ncbi:hypothetical protein [Cumulibacter manganitolerans]|uniref:hypothetical protein n=1 Tax=Cumulibacter manganitolerans TaxID=1884992 RepID=UPI001294C446|nr:hypothetical protein [Cumulibacter manganitolerans]